MTTDITEEERRAAEDRACANWPGDPYEDVHLSIEELRAGSQLDYLAGLRAGRPSRDAEVEALRRENIRLGEERVAEWKRAENAEAEIERLKGELPRWIPVSERLPKENGVYNVLIDHGDLLPQDVRGFHEGVWSRSFVAEKVLYWRENLPLPAAPDGGEE